MRPLELVVKGFRSHAGRTVIDWRGRRLVGVVGPIGSGKTSILDAVSFALYGKTPVFVGESKTLIHQGSESARVELAFEAAGATWRVIRVIRHVGVGRHVLYGDEAASAAPECDKEREVTARIEELLGLDFSTFCRSVLLAQNRFSEFLNASPGDRDRVLKGVFGFDRLDDMQALARQRRGDAALVLKKLEGRLATLADDEKRLTEARGAVAQSGDRLRSFQQVTESVRRLDTRESEGRRRSGEIQRRRAELEELSRQLPGAGEIEKRIGAAENASVELARGEEVLNSAVTALADTESERLATVARVGSAEDHARAESRLAVLRQAEEQVQRRAQRQAELQRAREASASELERQQRSLVEARRKEEHCRAGAERATVELNQTRDELARLNDEIGDRQSLARVREEVQHLRLSRADVARALEARGRIEQHLEAIVGDLARGAAERERALANEEQAQVEQRKTGVALTRAEEELHQAEHAEMAQTLAQTLLPGKPCPVCDQPVATVQARFLSGSVDRAQRELAAARETERKAAEELLELSKKAAAWRQNAENVEASRRATLIERDDAERQLKAHQKVRDGITAGLAEILGDGDPQALLVQAEERVTRVEAALRQREEAERSASEHAREANHHLELARQQEDAAQSALASAERQWTDAEAESRRAEASRQQARAEVESLLGEGDGEDLLARARSSLAQVEAELASKRVAQVAATRTVDAARRRLDEARAAQEHLASRLAGLAGQLGHVSEAGSEALTPRQLSVEVGDRLRAAQREAEQEARQVLADEKSTREERERIYLQLGLDASTDFEAALADARAAEGRDSALVADLEARLEKGAEMLEENRQAAAHHQLYVQLADDLTASKFLRYLLEQERSALADLGSERFEMLSEGRYRFTHDGVFHVIDQHNAGAIRKSDTLSGGETFLAALALALALAEKVTATGGRLDAFFLDEGFGSLDPEHLTLAMEGIERLVTDSPNRLVTIVSHVPEMRERIEDLIELDKDPMTGSTIVRKGAQRTI